MQENAFESVVCEMEAILPQSELLATWSNHIRKHDGVTSYYTTPQDGGANRTKVCQSISAV